MFYNDDLKTLPKKIITITNKRKRLIKELNETRSELEKLDHKLKEFLEEY